MSNICTPLPYDFFLQDADTVAKQLLGKELVFNNIKGIICETESYCEDDPASHSFGGKLTKRSITMRKKGGIAYVYFIYGMYYCFNIVTGGDNEASAVLIRGVLQQTNSTTSKKLKSTTYKNDLIINNISLLPANFYKLVAGPARVCRLFNIDTTTNCESLVDNPNFYVNDIGVQLPFITTTRIGISKGQDIERRFVIDLNKL